MLEFDLPKAQSNIIKVIGVGGGGNNAVNHMFQQGIKDVDFINCNTDAQVLEDSPVPVKIQLGNTGLGAGANPEVGKSSAEETVERINEVLDKNTQMIFITAGMGGGTGTGAAPIIAKVAREMNILTVGIVTIPFSFEGKRRKNQAIKGIEELKNYVDTLLVISNDKLRELYGNLKMQDAFHKADDILTTAAKGIAEIITVKGYINVDFEDVKTVMKNSGSAILGSGIGDGENRAIDAVEAALNSPLLSDNDIRGAKNMLLYITSGREEVTMDEIAEITDYISDRTGDDSDVIWGNGIDESLGEKISITLIATGFENRSIATNPSKVPTVMTLGESQASPKPTHSPQAASPSNDTRPIKPITEITLISGPAVNKNDDAPSQENAPSSPTSATISRTISKPIIKPAPEEDAAAAPEEEIDSAEMQEMKRRAQERRAKLQGMSLKLSQERIQEMERPAYERRNVNLEDTPSSTISQASRYSLEDGDKGPEIKKNNSFLYDNVD